MTDHETHSHDHYSGVLNELNPQHRALRQMIPDVYKGFGAGASKQEAAEAIGVGIMMHGGPATIYGARAYTAFCEFADASPSPSE